MRYRPMTSWPRRLYRPAPRILPPPLARAVLKISEHFRKTFAVGLALLVPVYLGDLVRTAHPASALVSPKSLSLLAVFAVMTLCLWASWAWVAAARTQLALARSRGRV